jgi:glyoxylate/succinic semialdehyde reductase
MRAQAGTASALKAVVNMFMGSTVAALAEALALAARAGVPQGALLDVIGSGALAAPIFQIKVLLGALRARNAACKCWPQS